MNRRISTVLLTLLLVYGLTAQVKQDFLSANIDPSTPPSVDFFQYANGGWIKKTPTQGAIGLLIDTARDNLELGVTLLDRVQLTT